MDQVQVSVYAFWNMNLLLQVNLGNSWVCRTYYNLYYQSDARIRTMYTIYLNWKSARQGISLPNRMNDFVSTIGGLHQSMVWSYPSGVMLIILFQWYFACHLHAFIGNWLWWVSCWLVVYLLYNWCLLGYCIACSYRISIKLQSILLSCFENQPIYHNQKQFVCMLYVVSSRPLSTMSSRCQLSRWTAAYGFARVICSCRRCCLQRQRRHRPAAPAAAVSIPTVTRVELLTISIVLCE